LQWIKGSDGDVLIVDEDSGNKLGERKYALKINPVTMQLADDKKGYFLAMGGGKDNPRAAAKVSAYGGTFSKAAAAEFSSSWDVTALVARKADGSFYSQSEIAGMGQAAIQASLPLNEKTLIGVIQHIGESGGAVKSVKADKGGQVFIYSLDLPK
jgi:hypothetical protein